MSGSFSAPGSIPWTAGSGGNPEAKSQEPGRRTHITWRDPHHLFFLLLLAISVVVFWLPRLPTSLWLDETITAWIASPSFGEMLDRAREFQAMPPTYFVVAWATRAVGGTSEMALRMPSVLAMALALYLLYRLGRRLFDAETGLLAAVVLAAWNEGAHLATDARPYALGVLAFIAATLSLLRWVDGGRTRDGIAYVLLADLVVYLHFLLAPALLAHMAYIWRRRRDLRSGWSLAVGGAAFAILLLPLLPLLLAIFDRRDALSFGFQSPGATLLVILPPALLVAIAGSIALVAPRIQLDADTPAPLPSGLTLVWVWAAAPPIALFVISRLMDAGVLGPQHVTQSAPAIALLAAAAIRRLGPPQVRRIMLVCMAIVSLVLGASQRQYADDWQGAIQYSNGLVNDASTPILVRSTLIESSQADWLMDPTRATYMLSPVKVYPTRGRPVVLPFGLSAVERRYLEAEVIPIAESASRLSAISIALEDPVLPWLQGRLRSEGFELTERRMFGSIVVALFERV